MAENDVDIVHLESLERSFDALDDMFTGKIGLVRCARSQQRSSEHLSAHNNVFSADIEFFESFAHYCFGLAI